MPISVSAVRNLFCAKTAGGNTKRFPDRRKTNIEKVSHKKAQKPQKERTGLNGLIDLCPAALVALSDSLVFFDQTVAN
jgi:hypothetical protein